MMSFSVKLMAGPGVLYCVKFR